MVNHQLKRLLSWCWPGRCLRCRATIGFDADWCGPCHTELPWLDSACRQCAAPLPQATANRVCGACQQRPPPFQQTVAALRYQAPIDKLILNLKYHQRLDIARVLGSLLATRLKADTFSAQAIVPIPLHTSRLRERGYNQSVEVGQLVGRELGLPVMTSIARRVRATAAQSTLARDERAHNVRNAFTVDQNLNGLRIAIVDDVMTSGHTVSAFAKALRRAGAGDISVWVVARA